ncbi:MAG: S41 family peptidase, partial [Fimbriimonadales bacterium]
VYTCEGDLWIGDLTTRKAMRITRDVGTEMDARFSPDGTMIAYDGELDGVPEIYVMPTAGGAPKRLTYMNDFTRMVTWKDDHTIVFLAYLYPASAPTLFSIDVNGGEPVRLPLEFASTATFAPDGNRFVFSRYQRYSNAWFRYQGGLKNPVWTGNLKNLNFKQIYEGSGSCEFPTWLGDRVYFTTQENGSWYLDSVKLDGGGARHETPANPFELRYLHGDGKRLVYEHGLGIEVFDPATGKATPVQFEMVSDLLHTRPFMVPAETAVQSANIGPTGKRILVETRGQIVSLPVKEGDARVVLARDGVRFRLPGYSPDGKKIAYFSDETGEMQLCVCDADGTNQRQLTATSALSFRPEDRPRRAGAEESDRDGTLLPGEQLQRQIPRLAATPLARGDKHGRQLDRIVWAPDGKSIGYGTSEGEIHLVDLATGADKLVFKGEVFSFRAAEFEFSPDSKWLLINDLDLWVGMRFISLYDIAAAKLARVSTGLSEDMSPRFSKDGKYLAFLSRRNLALTGDGIQNHLDLVKDVKAYLLILTKDALSPLKPKDEEEGAAEAKDAAKEPFKLDLDGLYGRFVELPIPPAQYDHLEFAADRVLAHDPIEGEIRFYDLKTKKAGTLATAAPSMQLSDDGKHVLIAAGPNLRVIDATGENDTKVGFAGLQIRIDPKAEWKEMFWDAWRTIRDYFYVQNLHGADWPAIGAKYAAMLPSVRSRDELDLLLRWLQGELSISHSFLSNGDVRSLVKPARPSFLGADLEPGENGFYRIKHIYRGMDFEAADRSPLAEPGLNIKDGDYLIEVGSRPAKIGTSWREALLGRAGQQLTIKVNATASAAGARSVEIKPAASEQSMRRWDWVEQRRQYVDKASGGKLAYLHLQAMSTPDMADFIRQYFPQRNKQGLVVDVRFNTGGFVSDYIITILKQKGLAFWNARNTSVPWTRQSDFFPGPMVCLENEFNYSDGEEFPYYFRAMKLGPVIGRRTRGGEVGSDPGWPLADGGRVSVPNYGMFSPESGWVIEGHGVEPDIDVLSDPNAWARGKDPQLDKAIEVLMEQMAKHPYKIPAFPPDPVKVKGGG